MSLATMSSEQSIGDSPEHSSSCTAAMRHRSEIASTDFQREADLLAALNHLTHGWEILPRENRENSSSI